MKNMEVSGPTGDIQKRVRPVFRGEFARFWLDTVDFYNYKKAIHLNSVDVALSSSFTEYLASRIDESSANTGIYDNIYLYVGYHLLQDEFWNNAVFDLRSFLASGDQYREREILELHFEYPAVSLYNDLKRDLSGLELDCNRMAAHSYDAMMMGLFLTKWKDQNWEALDGEVTMDNWNTAIQSLTNTSSSSQIALNRTGWANVDLSGISNVGVYGAVGNITFSSSRELNIPVVLAEVEFETTCLQ